jgi:hypothetical protein
VLDARHDLDLAAELHVHVRVLHPLHHSNSIPPPTMMSEITARDRQGSNHPIHIWRRRRRRRKKEEEHHLGALDGDDGAVGEDALVNGPETALSDLERRREVGGGPEDLLHGEDGALERRAQLLPAAAVPVAAAAVEPAGGRLPGVRRHCDRSVHRIINPLINNQHKLLLINQ